jgi:hypothetical protein
MFGSLGPVHTVFDRCVASQKGQVLGAAVQPHLTCGQPPQQRNWPFWPQPGGNVLKTAPLVVTLLAKASSLGVVARLDWRGFKRVRTAKNSVNRP